MQVLVTGFEPFGGDDENASAAAVGALRGVATGILPVEFGASGARLLELVAEHGPDVVMCVGEAGLRRHVCVERRARNLIEARIPDNAGVQPHGEVIDPSRPDWLETSLDVAKLAGNDAVVSDDAGLFVCNYLYFRALADLDVPAVFVHVPAVRTRGHASVGAETDDSTEAGPLPTVGEIVVTLEGLVASVRNGH